MDDKSLEARMADLEKQVAETVYSRGWTTLTL